LAVQVAKRPQCRCTTCQCRLTRLPGFLQRGAPARASCDAMVTGCLMSGARSTLPRSSPGSHQLTTAGCSSAASIHRGPQRWVQGGPSFERKCPLNVRLVVEMNLRCEGGPKPPPTPHPPGQSVWPYCSICTDSASPFPNPLHRVHSGEFGRWSFLYLVGPRGWHGKCGVGGGLMPWLSSEQGVGGVVHSCLAHVPTATACLCVYVFMCSCLHVLM
jgi:hypothetical protein